MATNVPELGKVNPAHFGVAAVTVDDRIFEVGDTHAPFTIQSISKTLVYAMALEALGRGAMLKRVGVGSTGADDLGLHALDFLSAGSTVLQALGK